MVSRYTNSIKDQRRALLLAVDPNRNGHLKAALEVGGFRLETVSGFEQARARSTILAPDVLLIDLDVRLGRDLLGECQKVVHGVADTPVVLITNSDWFDLTSELLKAGAADFLIRPISSQEVVPRIEAVLTRRDRSRHKSGDGVHIGSSSQTDRPACGEEAEREDETDFSAELLMGQSPAILHVKDQVRIVAPRNTTVLITGETGTGKEWVARAIHALSDRQNRKMVSVNCGGIPASLLEDEFFGHVKGAFTDAHQARIGRFEQADRSTIFLDEIGDLPLELQPKLLRVLQEREMHPVGGVEAVRFDARVIAATNMDLWSRVQEGNFREDLFYRINVFPIHLPPLRERREDIPLFIEGFLERFCRRDRLPPKRLDPAAEAELVDRPWPGNIRELENAVEIAVIRSQERTILCSSDFPEPRPATKLLSPGPSVIDQASFRQIVSDFERDLIQMVLERTSGNKTKAAEVLQLKRTTLVEKLKKLESKQPSPRR